MSKKQKLTCIGFFGVLCYNVAMINENEFKQIVARNITKFRKANGLTQLELAIKLNYSDKAVSKWERGESLPDVYMLQVIASMFGITLNDLVSERTDTIKPKSRFNRGVVLALSIGLTWLIAVATFVFLNIFNIEKAWLLFIYAIPVSLIISIIFSNIWKYKWLLFFSISGLYYTIPLSICITLNWVNNIALLFIIAAPLQLLTILWFFRKRRSC